MSMIWSVFLYLSAGLFWLVVGISVYKSGKGALGTNEKVRTHEDIVAVLKPAKRIDEED